MLKRVILVFVSLLCIFNSFGMINNYEHSYSFVSSYLLGIGKAGLAVDNLGIESFLFNPASGYLKKFSFELVGVGVSLNSDSIDAINYISSLVGSGDQNAIIDYAVSLIGKPIYPSLKLGILGFSVPFSGFSLNFGIVSSSINFYFEFHNPLSTAGFMDFLASVLISPYIGLTLPLGNFSSGNSDIDNYLLKRLNVGLNLRLSFSIGVSENITLGEIVSGQYNLANLAGAFTNVVTRVLPDLGFLYKIPLDDKEGSEQRLNIALGVKDIGGVVFRDLSANEFVFIPTTFNIGVAYFIDLYNYFGIHRSFRENYISLDFHDLFFQRRDKDFFKRIHIGISSELYNLDDLISFKFGLGINGGYPTLGFSLKLTAVKLGFSVYTEELGVYAGQDPDTRYVFSASIGW